MIHGMTQGKKRYEDTVSHVVSKGNTCREHLFFVVYILLICVARSKGLTLVGRKNFSAEDFSDGT